MALSATPVFPQTPNRGLVEFVGTTDAAGTYKTVYTGGVNGSDVNSLIVTNGATAHNMTLAITNGSTSYVLGVVPIGVSAGQNGTLAAVDMLSATYIPGLPVDGNGKAYVRLAGTGDTLQMKYATAQGTADTIYGVAGGADY